MKITLEQLKLADELCFPDNFEAFLKEEFPDDWGWMRLTFYRNRSLISWIFDYSRATAKHLNLYPKVEKLIKKLLVNTPLAIKE